MIKYFTTKLKSTVCLIILCFIIILTGCELDSGRSFSDSGVGGSLSRFTIVGDYMYAVDNQNLKVFNISQPDNPSYIKKVNVGFDIETIFANNSLIFIGAETGMYIFSLNNPQEPVQLSRYDHIYSCDPVVADDKYAYVTLSTDWNCGRYTNELQIIDITDPSRPELIDTYPMERPKGLGVLGDRLYICDDDHLKVFDKSNVLNLEQINSYQLEATDVIPLETLLLVVANNGLYEYEYTGQGLSYLSSVYESE